MAFIFFSSRLSRILKRLPLFYNGVVGVIAKIHARSVAHSPKEKRKVLEKYHVSTREVEIEKTTSTLFNRSFVEEEERRRKIMLLCHVSREFGFRKERRGKWGLLKVFATSFFNNRKRSCGRV